jgi:hypothetical protein
VVDIAAKMVPAKVVRVPSVADEPTCQKILQACAPPVSTTEELVPVISVEPNRKTKRAFGSPWPLSVEIPLLQMLAEEVEV